MNKTLIMQALGENEVAEIMNKSVQTLRNDRHMGKGCPYIKLGRSVRYLLEDVEQYIINHRIDPESK